MISKKFEGATKTMLDPNRMFVDIMNGCGCYFSS